MFFEMKVFISGSISKKTLSKTDIAYLEPMVESNCTLLIGDAYGVDKVVQSCCKIEYFITFVKNFHKEYGKYY